MNATLTFSKRNKSLLIKPYLIVAPLELQSSTAHVAVKVEVLQSHTLVNRYQISFTTLEET